MSEISMEPYTDEISMQQSTKDDIVIDVPGHDVKVQMINVGLQKYVSSDHQDYARTKSWSIYRVEQNLKNVHEESTFHPKLVSIGPHHNKSDHLKPMEQHKWRFLSIFTSDDDTIIFNKKIQCLVAAMEKLEARARACYSETFDDLGSNEFVRMMILDGCFIIQLLLLFQTSGRSCRNADDPMYTWRSTLPYLRHDLLLLENQLPFIVLQEIFNMSGINKEKYKLTDLILDFFNPVLYREKMVLDECKKQLQVLSNNNKDHNHLLHLFMSSFQRSKTVHRKDQQVVQDLSDNELDQEDKQVVQDLPDRELDHVISPNSYYGYFPEIIPHAYFPEIIPHAYFPEIIPNQYFPEIIPEIIPNRYFPEIIPNQYFPEIIPEIIPNQYFPEIIPTDTDRNHVISLSPYDDVDTCSHLPEVISNDTDCNHVIPLSRLPEDMPERRGSYFSQCIAKGRSFFYIPNDTGHHDQDISIHCVTELREAGVGFKKRDHHDLLDIEFKNGKLHIPTLFIDDNTVPVLLNFIAYEQRHHSIKPYFTSYLMFLDYLVNSSKDVEHLHYKGIINHGLGSDEEVATLFNKLCKEVVQDLGDNNYLSQVFIDVNRYFGKRRNRWRAAWKHEYFRNPWAFSSFLAAIVLIVLTFLQTFFSVYAYIRPPSN